MGKSVSLRTRARAHFCAPAGWTERAEVADYRPTNSELGALVLENRLIISRLFPQAFSALKVQRLASTYRALFDGLRTMSGAGKDARIVLLTPGPYNETYFEHAYLARYLGLTLVEAGFLLSLVQLAGMAAGLAFGLLADRLGGRRSMVCGLALLAVASSCGGGAESPAALMGWRALEGCGFLLVVLPVAILVAAHRAVGPRLRLPGRRSRRPASVPRSERPRSVARRVAPFVLLAVLLGASFAVTDDTTGTLVCFGVAAVLLLAVVADRWWRRRTTAGV